LAEDDADADGGEANNTPTRNPLVKLREGIVKIRTSPLKLDKFKDSSGSHLVLLLDVRTRWNSTYKMIEHAIRLKDAYVRICNVDDDLVKYSLQESDWQYLEEL
ncbi:hypothetical protein BGZ74_006806, partial [Mortierella antarctica]